ncbi:ABC transporter G family member 23 [Habropoda laboriosa]|uniref:ABC transporter G family member 23 n=1 Tax=Habropoda laboriosa TaxID=597456 RepID=A0A0L7QJZ0_9HYME|nr:ABC transporter G family member 23 [Habropoda laboriosa]
MVVQQAIVVRNAGKRYGKGVPILNGLNLTVPKGCIYGLLGSSGCGKTTLLSCVVGVKKLDSGDIWVLGGKPGTEESGIPGPRVGFMPQDVSLVAEFSVIGALYFFGRINGMEDHVIEERYIFLRDLLQLPPSNCLVKNMSGGQQRRLSLAAAILHKPELLILDEPTVGLDPVLRDKQVHFHSFISFYINASSSIWNYLVKITQEEGVTVVITTHYIEEARQADKIGLLRCGLLLAETSPRELLEQWNTDSLEEAFLNLSQLQSQNQTQFNVQTTNSSTEITDVISANSMYDSYAKKSQWKLQSSSKKRCQALLVKNGLQFMRHPGGVLFSLLLPIVELLCFFNAVGQDPKELSMYIVNHEAGNCNGGRIRGTVFYNETERTCDFVDLSCRFLDGINDSVVEKIYYDNYEKAHRDIMKHKSVGIMQFKQNFSASMREMLDDFLAVSDEAILSSRIKMELHNPDRQINLFIQKKLFESFLNEYEKIMKECKISPKYADIPVRFEQPIYGTKDQNYVSFVTPPFVLSFPHIGNVHLSRSGQLCISRKLLSVGATVRSNLVFLPGISLRAVLEKGNALDDPEVFTGFLVVSAWIAGFIAMCLIQLRVKST